MKHTLSISMSKDPGDGGIVSCRHVKVRDRIMRYLFGKERRLMIIVPGNSVRSMSIVEEGGENSEQYEAAT